MAEAQGEQYAVLFDSSVSPQAAIASGNSNIQTYHFDLRYARTASFQLVTDGGAKVNWAYQVTNLPMSPVNFSTDTIRRTILGATVRDDSYGSVHWSTVQSGSLVSGSAQGSTITIANSCNRVARFILNWDSGNTAGTSCKLLIVGRNMGFG